MSEYDLILQEANKNKSLISAMRDNIEGKQKLIDTLVADNVKKDEEIAHLRSRITILGVLSKETD